MASHPKLQSLIDKAVFDYAMIEDGDRILVGASGGKDSTALTEYFALRSLRPDCSFLYKAVAIQSDFAPAFPEGIARLFCEWGVPFEIIGVDVLARLKKGQKMNCWWCSSQRRLELSKYAREHGFNKIALGHHLDDILETALMNALTKGELAAMPPVLKFEKFPLDFIRPLCLADIPMIVRHAEMQGYISSTCTCSYQNNSGRKTARSRLDKLTDGNYELKRKLFDALRNINAAYLP